MSPSEKAIKINLDKFVHGTLAEIGAGQEVARWFFRVGGAKNTVAKTISAYDMAVSDAIYGASDRYVSVRRLGAMLDHEYPLLLERLSAKRGDTTSFFAFADTVAARSFSRKEEGHGWMGIRFQPMPHSEPSDIVIHVRMLDTDNMHEQEALGIVGINLIYGAFYLRDDVDELLRSLLDDVSRERIEIDMIRFSGPLFDHLDPRLMSLKLVELGLSDAAMFDAHGEAVQAGDALFGRPVLVLRGSFRPVTNTIMDMLASAKESFAAGAGNLAARAGGGASAAAGGGAAATGSGAPAAEGTTNGHGEPVVLMEMTLHNLSESGAIDAQDFLARAELLEALGQSVLITNLAHYHSVAVYLSHYTRERVGLVLGIPALEQVFDERYYTELEGGILEAFGRMFKARVEMLVYPAHDAGTDRITTVDNLEVAPGLRHLYAHLVENRLIVPLARYNRAQLDIYPRNVLALMKAGGEWEPCVPPAVAKLVKERGYFGLTPSKARS